MYHFIELIHIATVLFRMRGEMDSRSRRRRR